MFEQFNVAHIRSCPPSYSDSQEGASPFAAQLGVVFVRDALGPISRQHYMYVDVLTRHDPVCFEYLIVVVGLKPIVALQQNVFVWVDWLWLTCSLVV